MAQFTTPSSNPFGSTSKSPVSPLENSSIIALIENRSREVGLASLNLRSYEISITQFADNQTYVYTISTMYTWEPAEIIMCSAAQNSALRHRITEELGNLNFTYIARRYFNETKGAEVYSKAKLAVKEFNYESKYVSMAALSALH